jgi:hypothetical protein
MNDDLQRFVDRVKDRAGHLDRAPVEQAVRATAHALGSHLGGLPPALHDAVPAALHPELAAGAGLAGLQPAALYQQVAEQTGLRVGVALELVQSTVAELSESLTEPARALLRESLPASWAALVVEPRARARPIATAEPRAEAPVGHTLASGRPGGTRPLSEAPPPAGQADSIATSDDPHADRLASAQGLGPQDDERTLAKGRPGSRRTVTGSD